MRNLAVVVSSCDAFRDCWEPFLYSLDTYWPDCTWPVYMVSNEQAMPHDKVKFIRVGDDRGWASNLKLALQQVETEYILYLQEDYFLNRRVKTEVLREQLEYCRAERVDYLRLTPPFFDAHIVAGSDYAVSPPSAPYRLCLQAALWKKDTLDKLLIPGFNAWQFEREIESFIRKQQWEVNSRVLLSLHYPEKGFYYVPDTAVHKGMWSQNGVDFLISHGFEHLLAKRKIEGKLLTRLIHVENKMARLFSTTLVRILLKLKVNV